MAEGRLRIPDKAIRRAFAIVRGDQAPTSFRCLDALTNLKQETLSLFAKGRSYAEIAAQRGNSVATVRNTLYRIQDKLILGTKQELVVWAVRTGLLDEFTPGQ